MKKNNIQNNLSEEMIKNIEAYSEEIQTIKDPVEAIRTTIGYHIGSKGTMGHKKLIDELIQNAFDESLRKNSPCNNIIIHFDERSKMFTIEDNGRGIPFNRLYDVYKSHYTSSNYNKTSGDDRSAGVHGAGSKLVYALSNYFKVESSVLGKAMYIEAIEGVATHKKDIEVVKKPSIYQGTKVMFTPSIVLGISEVTCDMIFEYINSIYVLLKKGTKITFSGVRIDGTIFQPVALEVKDGIITKLYEENSISRLINPIMNPVSFKFDDGDRLIDIVFCYDMGISDPYILSYANFCVTTMGGTHVDGFMNAISNFFRNYMNKIYLGDKGKINILNTDVRTGLRVIINASHINPIFDAQGKRALQNVDMNAFVNKVTIDYLNEWIKTNSSTLNKLCKYFKDIAELRLNSEKSKVKLSSKYQTSALSGKPKKYVPPTKQEKELFIVEGDSAAGAAKICRDSSTQGIFPIRGKLPNGFTTTASNFLSNSEVASIITIVDGGYGKNFDLSKVKWEKIILMADADPDAAHIRCLLLKPFLLYMRDLVEDGRLYMAIPPLYGAPIGKKTKYFTDNKEFVEYNQKKFSENNIIHSVDNKKIGTSELTKIFLVNIDYVTEMDIVSDTFAINPLFLEFLLFNLNLMKNDLSKFKRILKSNYRFIDNVKTINGNLVITGLVDGKSHTVVLNDRLLGRCNTILNIINSNKYKYFNINGIMVSIYQLMEIYNNSKPKNIMRYKGLGEMNPAQLGESVMDINNRTLIRYTVNDINQEIQAMREIESNKSILFKDIKITKHDIE